MHASLISYKDKISRPDIYILIIFSENKPWSYLFLPILGLVFGVLFAAVVFLLFCFNIFATLGAAALAVMLAASLCGL